MPRSGLMILESVLSSSKLLDSHRGVSVTISGMLRLYYITICTITESKFTIGLYMMAAQWLLYYYALFHTYNQHKPRKFGATHQEMLTFCIDSSMINGKISEVLWKFQSSALGVRLQTLHCKPCIENLTGKEHGVTLHCKPCIPYLTGKEGGVPL